MGIIVDSVPSNAASTFASIFNSDSLVERSCAFRRLETALFVPNKLHPNGRLCAEMQRSMAKRGGRPIA
jgi:hypothetical protein